MYVMTTFGTIFGITCGFQSIKVFQASAILSSFQLSIAFPYGMVAYHLFCLYSTSTYHISIQVKATEVRITSKYRYLVSGVYICYVGAESADRPEQTLGPKD
jgi:hypothetical protein